MKELEERITKIITKTIKLNILFDIKKHVSPDVAQEVKDIAIEFSKYFFAESLRNLEASKDWSELFDQFIKERYK